MYPSLGVINKTWNDITHGGEIYTYHDTYGDTVLMTASLFARVSVAC